MIVSMEIASQRLRPAFVIESCTSGLPFVANVANFRLVSATSTNRSAVEAADNENAMLVNWSLQQGIVAVAGSPLVLRRKQLAAERWIVDIAEREAGIWRIVLRSSPGS
jgi:hypothetical protein